MPNLRPAVVEAALHLVADPALQSPTHQCTVLSQVEGLLQLWTELMLKGAHSKQRAYVAAHEQVFVDELSYPTWLSK